VSRTLKRREAENSRDFLLARLAARSQLNRENGCIEWRGHCRPSGYGYLSVNNVAIGVHRLAFQLHKGPIPAGLCVCHHCDNRRCLNPEHLFAGTKSENSLDAVRKGRFPPHPPPRFSGQSHPQAKLSNDDVRVILTALKNGVQGTTLARDFGVTPTQISRIKRGVSRVA